MTARTSPSYVNPEYLEAPLQPLAAGKTGKPQTLAAGGVKAVGKIVFTDNPSIGESITIGGNTITFVAASANENQVTIGANLSDTITALIAILDAHSVLGDLATYTKTDTNTALTVTSDTYAYADNGLTGTLGLAVSAGAVGTVTQMVGGQDKPEISMLTESTEITNAAGTEYFELPAGELFQRKTIINTGAGTAIVLGNLTGANVQVTLTQNQYISLQYLGGEWKTVVNTGTLA